MDENLKLNEGEEFFIGRLMKVIRDENGTVFGMMMLVNLKNKKPMQVMWSEECLNKLRIKVDDTVEVRFQRTGEDKAQLIARKKPDGITKDTSYHLLYKLKLGSDPGVNEPFNFPIDVVKNYCKDGSTPAVETPRIITP